MVENDVTEMGSQVFMCQCQLCKAQLQLTCRGSFEAEAKRTSEPKEIYNNDQECVKETMGLVQNLLESNSERLTGM